MEAIVPVVDFQRLSEEEERKKLRKTCEKPGCFRIINHSIPLTLMADMKSVVKYLHDLPAEIKMRNKPSSVPESGYRAASPTSPLYEGMGIYDMHASPQAFEDFCSNLNVSPRHRFFMLLSFNPSLFGSNNIEFIFVCLKIVIYES